MRRLMVVLLVATAAAFAVPSTVSAGIGPTLNITLVSHVEPLTFSLAIVTSPCVTGTFLIDSVLANGVAVTPVSVTENPADARVATMVLPSNTPGGVLDVNASCGNADIRIHAHNTRQWAALGVTKVVSGPVPDGTTFTVEVTCSVRGGLPPIDLHYTAAGGVHYVYFDNTDTCTITEPVNGGAQSVVIDTPTVDIADDISYAATVTNTFVVVVQPAFTG